ncbi:hypothetical protein BJF82_16715 [Kytococcus sp. CUA-901]|nr:hypothetical protein BJF82_16715 [Kytococcus sp. CUA-901]
MDDLGEAGVVAMWADMAQLDDIDPSDFDPSLEMTQEQLGMGGEQPEITGRVAATVRLTPDAIEMHGVSRDVAGMEVPAGGGDPPRHPAPRGHRGGALRGER